MIDELYQSFTDTAMRYCEGNIEQADHFLDCTWYEYYDRLRKKKEYIEWHNESVKKQLED